jgi:hypothetical protein
MKKSTRVLVENTVCIAYTLGHRTAYLWRRLPAPVTPRNDERTDHAQFYP